MTGTFPLNVQAGSPQYTLTSQITPTSSTASISVTNPDSIAPISNAYYTIQNADGSKWCTFYIEQWATGSPNNYTGTCTYSSSNTSDVFPEGSICWCIWCKEYYDSLTTSISTVNNEIGSVNNDINTLTPKVDESFVNAEKVDDTTLRLTRNDGTKVDISFPEGLNVRFISGENVNSASSSENELVVIESCTLTGEIDPRGVVLIKGGLGYLIDKSNNISGGNITGRKGFRISYGETMTVSGLLYNGSYVSIE